MQPVNPYLHVRDLVAALAFYERAFGFKRLHALPAADGRLLHAEMRHGESVVMIGLEAGNSKSPGAVGGSPVTLYVYVDDVDKAAAQARDAGGTIVAEPGDAFWGDRVATVQDPEGHRWMLATFKKLVPFSEMKPRAPCQD